MDKGLVFVLDKKAILEEEVATLKKEFSDEVREVLNDIGTMLVNKNRKYGNSALAPIRIFSKADPKEQLYVRIDDKLSRLIRGDKAIEDEDVILDMLGYLVLVVIQRKREEENNG